MDASENEDVFNYVRRLKEKLFKQQYEMAKLAREVRDLRVENRRLRQKLVPLREEGCDDE